MREDPKNEKKKDNVGERAERGLCRDDGMRLRAGLVSIPANARSESPAHNPGEGQSLLGLRIGRYGTTNPNKTRPSLSKTPNPKLLPKSCGRFAWQPLDVCVCGWVKEA